MKEKEMRSTVEEQLSSYIQNGCQHGFATSTQMVQLKAAQITKELKYRMKILNQVEDGYVVSWIGVDWP